MPYSQEIGGPVIHVTGDRPSALNRIGENLFFNYGNYGSYVILAICKSLEAECP
jgi:hypothetical protein